MNKNTVYIISVGSKPEYDISIESWRRWCDKNDVYYESTDKRIDLIERIKKAGYR